MKTVSEKTHDTFIDIMNNEEIIKRLKKNQSSILTTLLNDVKGTKKGTLKEYGMWLLKQMQDYYIMPLSGSLFSLINKDEKSTMTLGLLTPNKYTSHYLKYQPHTLELANIHSLKKGEGRKMMQQLISISKKLDVPISLWAETDKNVKYFSKYGFKSSGKIGSNNEHFMILEN